MSTRDITLRWDDPNLIEKGYKVYRSISPMDINNMPAPIAELEPNTTEYVDVGLSTDEEYYFMVEAYIDSHSFYSNEIKMPIRYFDTPTVTYSGYSINEVPYSPGTAVFNVSEPDSSPDIQLVSKQWEIVNINNEIYKSGSIAESSNNFSVNFDKSVANNDFYVRVRYEGDKTTTDWSNELGVTIEPIDTDQILVGGFKSPRIRQYDGRGYKMLGIENTSYYVRAIAHHNNGNFYVGDDNSYLTKYNVSTNEIWSIRPPNTRGISCIVIDSDENIYVGTHGYSSDDKYIAKYNSDGGLQWKTPNLSSEIIGLDVDSLGNVYAVIRDVILKCSVIDGSYSYNTELIDTDSSSFGLRNYSIKYVRTDNAGNVYITCNRRYDNQNGLIKTNTNLEILWKTFDGLSDNGAVTVNSNGNPIYADDRGIHELSTVDGSIVWSTLYNAVPELENYSIRNVGDISSSLTNDYYIATNKGSAITATSAVFKFDSTGKFKWIAEDSIGNPLYSVSVYPGRYKITNG